MSQLPLSFMNRLNNKTESAVFIFLILYFQRVPLPGNLQPLVSTYLQQLHHPILGLGPQLLAKHHADIQLDQTKLLV